MVGRLQNTMLDLLLSPLGELVFSLLYKHG